MSRHRFARAACVALIPAVALAAAAEGPAAVAQRGYATATLREPIFSVAEVAVQSAAYNNWLNENYAKLDEQRIPAARERLYYLIDSHIKHTFAGGGGVLPGKHDLTLEILFSWAVPLGVYGGNLVYNAVKAEKSQAKAATLTLPPGEALTLNGDLFELSSDAGWKVSFPYYFMIGAVRDMTAQDGSRVQMTIISTGTARDSSRTGRSQATLMLLFSPGADFDAFMAFWKAQLPIDSGDERIPLGVRDLTSQKNFDDKLRLHREMVAWKTSKGAIAVVYLGNDGTYQWNRPHFIDFVRAIQAN